MNSNKFFIYLFVFLITISTALALNSYLNYGGYNEDYSGYEVALSSLSENITENSISMYDVSPPPFYGDFEGDGQYEMLLMRQGNNLEMYNLPNLSLKWSTAYITVSPNRLSGAIADLNDDGIYEAYVHVRDGSNSYLFQVNLSDGDILQYDPQYVMGTDSSDISGISCSERNNECVVVYYVENAFNTYNVPYMMTINYSYINETAYTQSASGNDYVCPPVNPRPLIYDIQNDGIDEYIITYIGVDDDNAETVEVEAYNTTKNRGAGVFFAGSYKIQRFKDNAWNTGLNTQEDQGCLGPQGSPYNISYAISNPQITNIDGTGPAELFFAYGNKFNSDKTYNTYIRTVYLNDFYEIDTYPEDSVLDYVFECSYLSDAYVGGWRDPLLKDACVGCYNTVDREFGVMCASPKISAYLGAFHQQYFANYSWDANYISQEPYFDSSLGASKNYVNNYWVHSIEANSTNTEELLTPFGILNPSSYQIDDHVWSMSLMYSWMVSNPAVWPINYAGTDGALLYNYGSLQLTFGNNLNYDCLEQNCFAKEYSNPNIDGGVICVNETVTYQINVGDYEADNVNANLSAYYGELSQQDEAYKFPIRSNGSLFVINFKANRTANGIPFLINVYESGNNQSVAQKTYYFSVAESGCDHRGDSFMSKKANVFADTPPSESAAIITTDGDNAAKSFLNEVYTWTGFGTSVAWFILTGIILLLIIFQPGDLSTKFAYVIFIGAGMTVLGTMLGFISFVYVVLILIVGFLVIAVKFGNLLNGGGGG